VICQNKPFWVVQPKLSERATCECTRCFNLDNMLQKLRKERVVPYKNLDEVMKARFCSPPSVGCMDGSCTSCKLNKLSTDEDNVDLDRLVSWQQWTQKKIDLSAARRDGTGNEYFTRVTLPVENRGSLAELWDTFESELSSRGYYHLFVQKHQSKTEFT